MPAEDIRPESTGHTACARTSADTRTHTHCCFRTEARQAHTPLETPANTRSDQIQMETKERAHTDKLTRICKRVPGGTRTLANMVLPPHTGVQKLARAHPDEATGIPQLTLRTSISLNKTSLTALIFSKWGVHPRKVPKTPRGASPSSISRDRAYLSISLDLSPEGAGRGLVRPNYRSWAPRGGSPSCRRSQ